MIKLVCLLKRKSGMPFEDFIAYYESNHAPLAANYLQNACHYERRYIKPYGNPVEGKLYEPDYDVVTEIWFKDRATLDATMGNIANPEIAAIFEEDEMHLFDRTNIRLFTVEHTAETDMSAFEQK